MDQKPTSMMDLIDDPDEFGMIIALDVFGSLNLKGLAYVIDMPESSALRRVKELLKYEVITIDVSATAQSRGKYYRLTKDTEKMLSGDLNDQIPTFENAEDQVEYLRKLAAGMESLASFNSVLSKFTLKYLENLNPGDKPLTIKDHFISSSLVELNFQNKAEVEEFTGIYMDFHKKITKFHMNTTEKKEKAIYKRGSLYCALYPLSNLIKEITEKIK